ncbi:MAG: hypothetical protein FWF55_09615 [Treponema sp.]|nr:hypothetical protein [Treponema sp.]
MASPSPYKQWNCIKCKGLIDPLLKKQTWGTSEILCPYCKSVIKPPPVKSINEILANIHNFQQVGVNTHYHVYKYFTDFRHWYSLTKEGIFAPSKFIGYKDTTLKDYGTKTYEGYGAKNAAKNGKKCFGMDGRETEEILEQWFVQLDKETDNFKKLYIELEQFANKINRSLHHSIKNIEGSGGIHILKYDNI